MGTIILVILGIVLLYSLVSVFLPVLTVAAIPVIVLFIVWKIYEILYYQGKSFLSIKNRIQAYIDNSNELNRHIEELKNTPISNNRLDLGTSTYKDTSKWNMKRQALKAQKYAPNVYNCSRTVCDGARREPFKYICKYFGIDATDESLEQVETALNNFEAAEDGKTALKQERENILSSIKSEIPFLIRVLGRKKMEKNLDLTPLILRQFISQSIFLSTSAQAAMLPQSVQF